MSSAITRAAVPLEHRTGNRQLPIATAEDKSRERRIELEHNTIQCPSPIWRLPHR